MLRKSKSGFTLVEILIVVIILGILAAIVIPQFTGASQEAKASSLVSQLQTLRSQVLLYKLQHSDNLPILTTNWDALTGKSPDPNGDQTKLYGPYLQAVPKNPLNGLSNVVTGTDPAAEASAECGFVYDYGTAAAPGTGRIWGTTIDKKSPFKE